MPYSLCNTVSLQMFSAEQMELLKKATEELKGVSSSGVTAPVARSGGIDSMAAITAAGSQPPPPPPAGGGGSSLVPYGVDDVSLYAYSRIMEIHCVLPINPPPLHFPLYKPGWLF